MLSTDRLLLETLYQKAKSLRGMAGAPAYRMQEAELSNLLKSAIQCKQEIREIVSQLSADLQKTPEFHNVDDAQEIMNACRRLFLPPGDLQHLMSIYAQFRDYDQSNAQQATGFDEARREKVAVAYALLSEATQERFRAVATWLTSQEDAWVSHLLNTEMFDLGLYTLFARLETTENTSSVDRKH